MPVKQEERFRVRVLYGIILLFGAEIPACTPAAKPQQFLAKARSHPPHPSPYSLLPNR